MEITKKPFEHSSNYAVEKLTKQPPLPKETLPQEEQQASNKKEEHSDKEKVLTQIESMNKVLEMNMTSLKFNLHKETERYFVQVRDVATEKVIREIPTKEFLDLMARITEFTGILVDKKA